MILVIFVACLHDPNFTCYVINSFHFVMILALLATYSFFKVFGFVLAVLQENLLFICYDSGLLVA